jgi:hypothetical protein
VVTRLLVRVNAFSVMYLEHYMFVSPVDSL